MRRSRVRIPSQAPNPREVRPCRRGLPGLPRGRRAGPGARRRARRDAARRRVHAPALDEGSLVYAGHLSCAPGATPPPSPTSPTPRRATSGRRSRARRRRARRRGGAGLRRASVRGHHLHVHLVPRWPAARRSRTRSSRPRPRSLDGRRPGGDPEARPPAPPGARPARPRRPAEVRPALLPVAVTVEARCAGRQQDDAAGAGAERHGHGVGHRRRVDAVHRRSAGPDRRRYPLARRSHRDDHAWAGRDARASRRAARSPRRGRSHRRAGPRRRRRTRRAPRRPASPTSPGRRRRSVRRRRGLAASTGSRPRRGTTRARGAHRVGHLVFDDRPTASRRPRGPGRRWRRCARPAARVARPGPRRRAPPRARRRRGADRRREDVRRDERAVLARGPRDRQLVLAVLVERPVPVEVVRRRRRHHKSRGPRPCRRTGSSTPRARATRSTCRRRARRGATDVAEALRRLTQAREEEGHERRGRRLALRPGHGHHAAAVGVVEPEVERGGDDDAAAPRGRRRRRVAAGCPGS